MPSTVSGVPSSIAFEISIGPLATSAAGKSKWSRWPRDLTAKLQRIPSQTEIAEGMGLGANRWRQLLVELRNINMAATPEPEAGKRRSRSARAALRGGYSPDRMFARSEIRTRLASAMASLPKRYQEVITLYYDRDMNMKEIGTGTGSA